MNADEAQPPAGRPVIKLIVVDRVAFIPLLMVQTLYARVQHFSGDAVSRKGPNYFLLIGVFME